MGLVADLEKLQRMVKLGLWHEGTHRLLLALAAYLVARKLAIERNKRRCLSQLLESLEVAWPASRVQSHANLEALQSRDLARAPSSQSHRNLVNDICDWRDSGSCRKARAFLSAGG